MGTVFACASLFHEHFSSFSSYFASEFFFLTPFFLCQYSSRYFFCILYRETTKMCRKKTLCFFHRCFEKESWSWMMERMNRTKIKTMVGERKRKTDRWFICTSKLEKGAQQPHTHIHTYMCLCERSFARTARIQHLCILVIKKIFILKCCVKVKFLLPEFCFIIVISFAECRLWWCYICSLL